MKLRTIILLVAMALAAGCSSRESKKPGLPENDIIRNEVKTTVDSFMVKMGKLDAEGVIKFCADTTQWITLNMDGSQYDLPSYRKALIDFANSALSYKWTLLNQEFVLLSPDLVLCSRFERDETLYKTGEKMIIDPHGISLVFRKINGKWKLIYSHDSGVPVIMRTTPVK
jgi:hypothetical protein